MNGDQHRLWIATTADSKGEFVVTRERDIGVSLRHKSVFNNVRVCPLSGPMVKDLRRSGWSLIHDGSGDLTGVKTNLVINDLESTRLNHQDLSDVGLSHTGPAFLLLDRLEEFLEGNEPIRVWHQTKFVRPSTENVRQELCKPVGLTSCH